MSATPLQASLVAVLRSVEDALQAILLSQTTTDCHEDAADTLALVRSTLAIVDAITPGDHPAMSASPDCFLDPDGDREELACLRARVAELTACLDAPVRLVQIMPGGTPDSAELYALDDQGRLWFRFYTHAGCRWEQCPGPTLDETRP